MKLNIVVLILLLLLSTSITANNFTKNIIDTYNRHKKVIVRTAHIVSAVASVCSCYCICRYCYFRSMVSDKKICPENKEGMKIPSVVITDESNNTSTVYPLSPSKKRHKKNKSTIKKEYDGQEKNESSKKD